MISELSKKISRELSAIPNLKTKDVDSYSKKLIREKVDVSSLKDDVNEEGLLFRPYFQVSLSRLKTFEEQFAFIEQNENLLNDWVHTDMLLQFLKKPIDFEFAFEKAKTYVNSDRTYTRRWGYVLFLAGLQKETANTNRILSLIKNDDEHAVQIAQAWLICDLAVFNKEAVFSFIENCGLKYNILGKAIQKICDSFRFSDADKERVKALREKVRGN